MRCLSALTLGLCALVTSCNPARKADGEEKAEQSAKPAEPAPIMMDGSSTVLPISQGVLRLYASELVTDIKLAGAGTGAGFKKLCRKETAINGASRPISPTEEKLCRDASVEYIELAIAFDGIAVVVNKDNDWATHMTVAELKKLWAPDAQQSVRRWKDIRRTWPDDPIALAGPGIESGTFDFFTQVVTGQEHSSRADYKVSEDDDVLVEHVVRNKNALAYFGMAYFAKNRTRLRAVAIDDQDEKNGDGAVLPTPKTVADGSYQPLSRPLFLYVSKAELARQPVEHFVEFYLRNAHRVAPNIGYVALPERLFELAGKRLKQRITGSVFEGIQGVVGLSMQQLLEAEQIPVIAE